MPRSQREVETQLQKLATAMGELALWSESIPTEQAMLSNAPFACDSMAFEKWLQFIFIPKLNKCMQLKQPLPNQMGLYAMGEQCFSELKQRQLILPILRQIDQLFAE
ncbi:YqcC family protein [Paraglaciecola hydrolytica]|uniref:YqcC-like domain-containing protein n=1 Tax=Paraglaciecola hydrolytica TaxID=1799789 RepID=A0A135ZYW8_9ALTE|nr:YqcC family protein [Paraglaciecola hydrolytica]KXI28176.1 hypothetical protein AX660_17510 [Paraglaciecola hydrolytica]